MNARFERTRQVSLIVVCFLCIFLDTTSAGSSISFTKVDYDADPEYIKLTCTLRNEGGVSVADVDCSVLKELGDNLYVNLWLIGLILLLLKLVLYFYI